MSFNLTAFRNRIKGIQNEEAFNECALELFRYQALHVRVYADFLRLLKTEISAVNHYEQIPFLPVTLFRNNVITDQGSIPPFYFESSGTMGQQTSKHYLHDKEWYDETLLDCFRYFYGEPDQYCFLALLPSYLERSGSSLVYMMQQLINKGANPLSGFFLHDHPILAERLKLLKRNGEKIFLIGVTYALLDFFSTFPTDLGDSVVMETGGMKGRRKELVKQEVHEMLKRATSTTAIHSEYGMTELLSQAYSTGNGIFKCVPWMKILVGDLHDPLSLLPNNETGQIKVIDLANIHSCAFIETQDMGRISSENNFEILGRIDNSELRGCNLMIG